MTGLLTVLSALLVGAFASETGRAGLGEVSPLVVEAHEAEHTENAVRPLVVLLHGRGYKAADSATFRRDVTGWIQEGARRATGESIIRTSDVELVWYSDLLDTRRTPEQCAIPQRVDNVSAFGAIAAFAGSLMEIAGADSVTASRGMRAFAGEVRWFTDAATRCAAAQRLDAVLQRAQREARPIILLAYSFGGLVAWNHLHGMPGNTRISSFITVGSPVASAGIRQLLFSDPNTVPMLPPAVEQWVNIVDDADPFAAPLYPSSDATAERGGPAAVDSRAPLSALRDIRVRNRTQNAHDLREYLLDPTASRGIIGAWCAAASPAPAGCGAN